MLWPILPMFRLIHQPTPEAFAALGVGILLMFVLTRLRLED
jgi:hypothetical protein